MNPRLELSFACLLLAACSTTPPVPPPVVLTNASPEAMVAAIRAAAGNDERELAVQPLRDPMVEDLRQSATRLEAQQHYVEAAAALDKALAIVPDDPALLQERAEAALLLKDPAAAEALARRAYGLPWIRQRPRSFRLRAPACEGDVRW
jgi:tetratricopeptide (TPR) repeat protein